jgi:hypothetical protein
MIKRSWFKRCFNRFLNFRLRKLYLDCIDEQGNCFIVYMAEIKTFLSSLVYSGLIFSDESGQTKQKHSFRSIPSPPLQNKISINNEHLKIKGSWENIHDPISATLFSDSSNNDLIWNCHHPKANVEILYENRIYKGLGYGETINLTIKPWELPINELMWGRFLSDKYSVIWIHWSGSFNVNKIYCNGKEYNDLIIDLEKFHFNNGSFTLIFDNIQVIRDGKISDSVPVSPLLKIISKRRMLATVETKYKSKSTLAIDSETVASGWSLYETVLWKK